MAEQPGLQYFPQGSNSFPLGPNLLSFQKPEIPPYLIVPQLGTDP